MKRKFLIWSAVLTVVFGAALLQSCSADDDTFATEEYGYYTEDEIAAIKAMAKMYKLNIDVNECFYGPKKTMKEIEEEMLGVASILGKYEMVHKKDEDGRVVCVSRKKENFPRTVTRFVEGKGDWSGSTESACRNYMVSVTISWDVSQSLHSKRVSGTASAYVKNSQTNDFEEVGSGGISCSFSGDSSINFSGSITADKEVDDYVAQTTTFIKYSFSIQFGTLSTESKLGEFDLTAYQSEVVTPW